VIGVSPRLDRFRGARLSHRALFWRDRSGNVAITFGLVLSPMLMLIGAALDYSGASELKTQLQRATDATALQLCQMPATATQGQLDDTARKGMAAGMNGRTHAVDRVAATNDPRQVAIETSAPFPTAVMRAFSRSYETMPVKAFSTCQMPQHTFEIALVLDNTGSMAASSGGMSKMDALKVAARDFVNRIYDDPATSGRTKVSIVPFAAAVAVNPTTFRYANWIDQDARSPLHWQNITGAAAAGFANRFALFDALRASVPSWGWAGCFESLPYPLNVQDAAPTPSNPDSYYVPLFAPDESGDGGDYDHRDGVTGATVIAPNSYLNDSNTLSGCGAVNDERARTGRACKYKRPTNAQTTMGSLSIGPNFSCTTRPLTRLTNNRSLLLGEINAMAPAGNTDIHEGMVWGWRTLSPRSVFADGTAYGTLGVRKVVVLMTDGDNTWTANGSNPILKSLPSAKGFFANVDGSTVANRLPAGVAVPTSNETARTAMNALTLESCRNAAAAGVTIYTIGFSTTGDPMDQTSIDLLKQCAGSPDRAFVASDSGAIQSVFQQVAKNLSALRLSQ
jgi:Flp pilus assembly protein TadG